MIDLHSHLLPGLDDATSLWLRRRAFRSGLELSEIADAVRALGTLQKPLGLRGHWHLRSGEFSDLLNAKAKGRSRAVEVALRAFSAIPARVRTPLVSLLS